MGKYNHIVLNVPHASIEGLCESTWPLGAAFYSQIRRWTDWYTDFLFQSEMPNIRMVRNTISRFIVDVERLMNDPLEERGEGIVYNRFEDMARNVTDRERILLMHYYHSYIRQLQLALSPGDLLIDCHSFPSDLSPMTDICLGFNEDWSRPSEDTIEQIARIFREAGYHVDINTPYSNSISPYCDFNYESITIEVNNKVYE